MTISPADLGPRTPCSEGVREGLQIIAGPSNPQAPEPVLRSPGRSHYSPGVAVRTPVSIAIDAGTHRGPGPGRRRAGAGGGRRLPGADPALPAARAGSSTTPARSGGWSATTLVEVAGRLGDARPGGPVDRDHQPARDGGGLGPDDRRAHHRALVWQDRRTAERCAELTAAGHLPLVREQTGLVLDPYFSATKMQWLLEEGGVADGPDLVLATVDTWILWNLTGGTDGGTLATDVTNASRTMLFDIVVRRWSDELCDLFHVPASALAEVRPSCGRFGTVRPTRSGGGSPLAGVPVSAMIGDQHAALFGQACFDRGHDQGDLRHRAASS